MPFAQVAHASGMFGGLGQKTIQMIVDQIGVNESGLVNLKTVEELCAIEGVQEITAKQFNAGLEAFYSSELSGIFQFSYIETPHKAGGPLSGRIICFTGFRSAELKETIEKQGGQVVDSLTKNVTTLVTKEKDSTSSKVVKAKQWGIEVISREEFEGNL